MLLLTATDAELPRRTVGLVQYVEPTGTLLGGIATFRKVFCAEDDRTLVPGQEHELQRRRQDREFQPCGCSSFHKATMFFRKAMFPRCAAEAALIPASTGTRGV